MSCDYAIWSTRERLDAAAAGRLYVALCDGETAGVEPSPAIDAFYAELTAMHPELDDVPEDVLDDVDLCPWSIAFDRSPGHLIVACVWSKADDVGELLLRLAQKHGLAFFDPQNERVVYPPARRPSRRAAASERSRPWWRFW